MSMTPDSEELVSTQADTGLDELAEDDLPSLQTVKSAVLIVEDDPAQREMLIELVAMWGYEPVPVVSAEEAEFAVRSRPVRAAIVDVFLPGRSGTTLMSRLRERFPDAMLIGTSALGDSAMARKLKGVGADLFLGKPIEPERLAEALQGGHKASWH
jgi:DNA-binding NtrC family response regulator